MADPLRFEIGSLRFRWRKLEQQLHPMVGKELSCAIYADAHDVIVGKHWMTRLVHSFSSLKLCIGLGCGGGGRRWFVYSVARS